jgi:hypothetical protein
MNYDTFHNCFLLLIKLSTKEEWDMIMEETFKHNDRLITSIYLSSFIIISNFIMMNFFIMIIVD